MRIMLGSIGRNTAYNLLKSNEIKHIRVGRKYKIPKRHIIDFLLEVDSENGTSA
ncbi:helix-turn-helix domain-containing protein [Enterococcus hulanensis]|uniref:helix-turn-helix domain-containing protein n=1 Tax=Enterococcus hulanensis TaxID=2559929 RepID=UPI002892DDAF|nr:helix-turn-helix domain-containing protein [Enterococcus hulanensis]